jgi:hypothetical protein
MFRQLHRLGTSEVLNLSKDNKGDIFIYARDLLDRIAERRKREGVGIPWQDKSRLSQSKY